VVMRVALSHCPFNTVPELLHCLSKNLTLRSSSNSLCGSVLRFQPAHYLDRFPSPKRQEASIMGFQGQIPGKAIGGFSVRSAEAPRTRYL
jgi:hypothetical protein